MNSLSCIATFVTFNNLFEIIKSNIKNSTQLPKTLKIITDKKIGKGGLGGNQYIYLFYGAYFWAVLSFNIGYEKPCSTAFGSFFFTWMVVTLYYRGTLSTSSLLWLYWYFLFLAVFRCLFVLVFIGELPFCIGQTGMS